MITLLTDFGSKDPYVGVMKGVILSINPSAVIVDISHYIDSQDLIAAAYCIKSCYGYFPKGTIHNIIVDPGVGTDRMIVAFKMMGHVFLAPNNGVLTLLMDEGKIEAIVRIENTRYFLNPVSRTFHGRDIFAPVGAHLSKGVELNRLGPALDRQNLVCLDISRPCISNTDELTGSIVRIDHFGNCISNIDKDRLKKFSGKQLEINIGKETIAGVSQSYADAEIGSPLAIIGSFGYLEIALNQGNASRYLNVKKGDAVFLKLKA